MYESNSSSIPIDANVGIIFELMWNKSNSGDFATPSATTAGGATKIDMSFMSLKFVPVSAANFSHEAFIGA